MSAARSPRPGRRYPRTLLCAVLRVPRSSVYAAAAPVRPVTSGSQCGPKIVQADPAHSQHKQGSSSWGPVRRDSSAPDNLDPARVIGIDEISLRERHTYRIVVSDLIRVRAIWFGGKDRSESSLEASSGAAARNGSAGRPHRSVISFRPDARAFVNPPKTRRNAR